jgi:hypothetical protein
MKPYVAKPEPRRDFFMQGFWLGLFFGVIGSLFILGKREIAPKAVPAPIPVPTPPLEAQ